MVFHIILVLQQMCFQPLDLKSKSFPMDHLVDDINHCDLRLLSSILRFEINNVHLTIQCLDSANDYISNSAYGRIHNGPKIDSSNLFFNQRVKLFTLREMSHQQCMIRDKICLLSVLSCFSLIT